MSDQPIVSKRSYCKICTNQCGVVIDVAGDEIVKVKGDFKHPLSKGYTCPKGRALGQSHRHPNAITRPLIRKNGQLVPISWSECLDDLAARLRKVVDTYGPKRGRYLFRQRPRHGRFRIPHGRHLYKSLGNPPKFSPLTIDGTAKVLVASLVGGFPGLSPKTDNDNVDMLLYVGVNPMVSHGHNTGMFNSGSTYPRCRKRGEVWTIDPLLTETAKYSTRHIAPYPGKDYAILAWLTREILDGGPIDLAQPVCGIEELLAAIPPERPRRGRNRHGRDMSSSANITQWLAWVLTILTGMMNRKGGVWFHPGFLTRFDSFELPIMDNPFSPGAPTMPEVSGIIGDWPCAALTGRNRGRQYPRVRQFRR